MVRKKFWTSWCDSFCSFWMSEETGVLTMWLLWYHLTRSLPSPTNLVSRVEPFCSSTTFFALIMQWYILWPNTSRLNTIWPNTSRLEAVYGHSLISNLAQGMYQQIHPYSAMNIDSVKLKSMYRNILPCWWWQNERDLLEPSQVKRKALKSGPTHQWQHTEHVIRYIKRWKPILRHRKRQIWESASKCKK